MSEATQKYDVGVIGGGHSGCEAAAAAAGGGARARLLTHSPAAVGGVRGHPPVGRLHSGDEKRPAGRGGGAPWLGLSPVLSRGGFARGGLKTGARPRLGGKTIDWAGLAVQPGDAPPVPFSFLTERITTPQIVCH